MTVYLARMAATKEDGTHELVGIVHCGSAGELFWLVDEFVDPSLVEYTELPTGMISARNGAVDVPDDLPVIDEDDIGDDDVWQGATLSGAWGDYMTGGIPSVWMSADDLIAEEKDELSELVRRAAPSRRCRPTTAVRRSAVPAADPDPLAGRRLFGAAGGAGRQTGDVKGLGPHGRALCLTADLARGADAVRIGGKSRRHGPERYSRLAAT